MTIPDTIAELCITLATGGGSVPDAVADVHTAGQRQGLQTAPPRGGNRKTEPVQPLHWPVHAGCGSGCVDETARRSASNARSCELVTESCDISMKYMYILKMWECIWVCLCLMFSWLAQQCPGLGSVWMRS